MAVASKGGGKEDNPLVPQLGILGIESILHRLGILWVHKYICSGNAGGQHLVIGQAEALGVMLGDLRRGDNGHIVHAVVGVRLLGAACLAQAGKAKGLKGAAGVPQLHQLHFRALVHHIQQAKVIVHDHHLGGGVQLDKAEHIFSFIVAVGIGEQQKLKINIRVVFDLVIDELRVAAQGVPSAGHKGDPVGHDFLFAQQLIVGVVEGIHRAANVLYKIGTLKAGFNKGRHIDLKLHKNVFAHTLNGCGFAPGHNIQPGQNAVKQKQRQQKQCKQAPQGKVDKPQQGHQHTAALHKGSISVFLFFRKKENGAVFAVKVEGVGAVSGLRRGDILIVRRVKYRCAVKALVLHVFLRQFQTRVLMEHIGRHGKGQRLHRVAAVLKVNGDGHRTFRLKVVKDLVQQVGVVAYHNAAPLLLLAKVVDHPQGQAAGLSVTFKQDSRFGRGNIHIKGAVDGYPDLHTRVLNMQAVDNHFAVKHEQSPLLGIYRGR